MPYKNYVVLLVVLFAVSLTAQLFGEWVRWTAIGLSLVGMAALGYINRVQLSDAARALRRATPFFREQFLVFHEEWEGRVELAEELGEPLPRVPIRGERETFTHDGRYPRLVRGIGWTSVFLLMLVAFDDLLIYYPEPAPWYDRFAAFAVFGGGAGFFFWWAEYLDRSIEVDEAGISEVSRRGTIRLAWAEVERVKRARGGGGIVLRAKASKLGVPNSLEGYGRLSNIILSRVGDRGSGNGDT